MTFRDYLQRLTERAELLEISNQISGEYEIAGVLKKLEPRPVMFTDVAGYPFPRNWEFIW